MQIQYYLVILADFTADAMDKANDEFKHEATCDPDGTVNFYAYPGQPGLVYLRPDQPRRFEMTCPDFVGCMLDRCRVGPTAPDRAEWYYEDSPSNMPDIPADSPSLGSE